MEAELVVKTLILRKLILSLSLIFIASISSSCTEIAASKAALNFALEDRPFGSSVQDTKTEISLATDFFDYEHTMPTKISVIVSERRALLVGELETQEDIDKITSIVWNNDYIIKVYNYIELADDTSDIIDSTKDIALNKLILAKLIGTEGVTSSNYKTLVHDKIAYVLGYSGDKHEKELALKAMKQVPGLRRVIPFIIIEGEYVY